MKPGTQQTTILIVEDTPDFRRLLVKALSTDGFRVIAAQSGHEAIELLDGRSVDLILSDVRMPNGDGFELVRAIRAKGIGVPVILMSGSEDLSDESARAIGADRFISKPFPNKVLKSAIEQVLGVRQAV